MANGDDGPTSRTSRTADGGAAPFHPSSAANSPVLDPGSRNCPARRAEGEKWGSGTGRIHGAGKPTAVRPWASGSNRPPQPAVELRLVRPAKQSVPVVVE